MKIKLLVVCMSKPLLSLRGKSPHWEIRFLINASFFYLNLVFPPLLIFPSCSVTSPTSDGVERWSNDRTCYGSLMVDLLLLLLYFHFRFLIIILSWVFTGLTLKFNLHRMLISGFQSDELLSARGSIIDTGPLPSPSATLKVWSPKRRGVEFQPGRWKRI